MNIKAMGPWIVPALLACAAARADDTDIYINPNVPPDAEPMVMFSIDYRPNLGATACTGGECASLIAEGYLPVQASYTFFDVLRAVFKKVMEPLDGVKVGLMLNHDHRNNCANKVQANCSNGGYIGRRFRSFEQDDSNHAKERFHQFLANMPVPQGDQSHAYQGKELFFEFYRYLSGQGVYNGHVGFTDYASSGANNLNSDNPLIDWDAFAENTAGTAYVSPISGAGACARIFTVNLMFQVSSQEADSDSAIRSSVVAGGMGLSGNPTFPTVIKWLHDGDVADGAHGTAPNLEGKQNVTSYFIVDPTKINTTTTAYAQAGGTGVPLALDSDPAKLVKTLTDVFHQILSVSTTFVAASVPVNVFNRAQIVDNVYLAVFQPDADAKPFWNGNIKKLKISGLDASNPVLVDANDDPAIAADGRIRYSAVTFWTLPGWLPPADPDESEVDGADGRAVHRGGAGQRVPGYLTTGPGLTNAAGPRKLFYDSGGSLAALNANDATATALQATLGAASAADALSLLKWMRGMDVDDEDADGSTTDARPWLMGDPLHSRPLPVNYGARDGYTDTNQAIFVAVAGNAGMLHFIRNTTTGGAESGVEEWAFMPQAVMGQVPVLKNNASGVKHPYLLDASPIVYMKDANNNGTIDSGEKAWLYIGMGRGGRGYYALDVSNPASPALLWSVNSSDSDFAELGYTLSEPRVITVDTGSGPRPALAFAGGYDTNKDERTGVGDNDAFGSAIFIMDAETGQLIWKAVRGGGGAAAGRFEHPDLLDSIPSTLGVLDSDGNGVHDRLYVGDTGGNVWRADIDALSTSAWKLTRLAALGRHADVTGSKTEDRRFHHRPDVVQGVDDTGPYDAVIIGSGDRPDPLDYGGVVYNWFYMIKDRNIAPGSGSDTPYTHDDLGDVTNTCVDMGGPCTADLANGWRLQLTGTGEKVLATPTTIGGTIYFTSYLPPPSVATSCSPAEGDGFLYAVRLSDAAAVRDYDATTEGFDRSRPIRSDGIPSEVVSLPPNWILDPGGTIESTEAPTRFETYWFEAEE